jgi:hypothetical protein
MRNLTLATACLAAILLAGPGFADVASTTPGAQGGAPAQAAATPAAVAAPTPPAHPRRHCVTIADTGRLIPQTTCYTEEEWQARLEAEREAHDQLQDRIAHCQQQNSSC